MKTNIQTGRSIILMCMIDRLNLCQINYIQKLLFPFITQPGQEIRLDLRHVRFMDCCAVGCLIRMNQIAQAHHTLLTLCNLRGNVKLLAETLKLSDIIKTDEPIQNKTHQSNPATHYNLSLIHI